MRTRYSRQLVTEDDLADKAGWMYADLFLALMVVFLATISFVPDISQGLTSANSVRIKSNTVTQSTNYNFDRGLTLLLKTPDGQLVSTKIREFLAQENLPNNAEVVFMKVIGGYEPNTGGESAATTRAIKFGMKLKKDNPNLFSQATMSVDISKSVAKDQVALVLTFAANTQK